MFLDELKKKGIFTDIIICPVCKSPRIQELTSALDLGFFGSFQPLYLCLDCGWYGRLELTMSNKPLNEDILEDLKALSLDQDVEEYMMGPDSDEQ